MKEYDVIIVGGGIHGAGVLQAAAAAGHSALLVEKRELASGTSSRSSKLIHGGLRYLESGQFSLVRESLRERAVHDGLETRNLDAVMRYYDAQTDDAALTRAVVESARWLGGELAMPATFLGASLEDDGVQVSYSQGGAAIVCRARVLVNAAGPWATQVARAMTPAIPVGRAVFIMPWKGATLVGTTVTPYKGEPDPVRPLPGEEEYLLAVVRRYFPSAAGMTRADIRERFAGLRVLPAASEKAFDRSRETIFTADRDPHPRVLGIYGGKLTGWRAAAAQVLGRIGPSLTARPRRAATDELVLRRAT
jgi:glycerol-3-phosphate dehydrogenase